MCGRCEGVWDGRCGAKVVGAKNLVTEREGGAGTGRQERWFGLAAAGGWWGAIALRAPGTPECPAALRNTTTTTTNDNYIH